MSNIVAIAQAREIRNRLWNPPNAKNSTELDIVTGPELRRRQHAIADQQTEMRRVETELRRQIAVDDIIRNALAEHATIKRVAQEIIWEECYDFPPKVAGIVNYIRAKTGVSRTEMFSRRKLKRMVHARWMVMYLARRLTFKSMPEIGRLLGGMDHTTILHGIRKIDVLMARDPAFKAQMDEYAHELAGAGA